MKLTALSGQRLRRNSCRTFADTSTRGTSHDSAGRQLSQTDPGGHTTTWINDAAGQEAITSVDGTLIAAIDRDLVGWRVFRRTSSAKADGGGWYQLPVLDVVRQPSP